MPVRAIKNEKGEIIGYQWGRTGKIYKTKAEAEKQGRAIKAAQTARAKVKSALGAVIDKWLGGEDGE